MIFGIFWHFLCFIKEKFPRSASFQPSSFLMFWPAEPWVSYREFLIIKKRVCSGKLFVQLLVEENKIRRDHRPHGL